MVQKDQKDQKVIKEESEIDVLEVLKALKRYWWILVVFAFLSTTVSALYSYNFLEDIYESNTTLYVGKLTQGTVTALLQELQLGENVIKDYSEILKSRTVMIETKKQLEADAKNDPILKEVAELTYKELNKKVSVSVISGTKILEIKVKDKNPEVSAKVADKLSFVFIDKVRKITKIDNVEVIDLAEVSEDPVLPSRKKNIAIAFIIGIIVGAGIIFLIELLDNTIKNSDDAKKHIPLPILGTVNVFDKESIKNISDKGLVVKENPKSSASESYRIIRSNIQFSSVDKEIKCLLVTGAGPSEGKSITSANLAAVFASTKLRILLVDGDLRKPNVHNIFGLPNKLGLTNVLSSDKNYKEFVTTTDIENLDLLTCGPIPPNPSELIGSREMKNIVEKLKADYDMVIIDSPPASFLTDAQILSTLTDATLMVVSAGKSSISSINNSIQLLKNVNAKIIGIVLNRVKSKDSYYSYYSYDETGDKVKKKNK